VRSHPHKRQQGVTLVELVVVMAVMTVVSGMIIGIWFNMTNAFSFGATSDKQQEFARDAVSRMSREIRDAQAPSGSTAGAFVVTGPFEVQFYSTFNKSDAADPGSAPRLTRFIWEETNSTTHVGTVYRELADTSGSFTSADAVSTVLVKDVVNKQLTPAQDLFTYAAFNNNGELYQSQDTSVTVAPSAVINVTITLMVDLNPGKSPKYMTVKTTVQPRNVRHL
jgi:prepilin-type N-terminal cleavage/methylation domain-containing protein